jgi:hypothetical protein
MSEDVSKGAEVQHYAPGSVGAEIARLDAAAPTSSATSLIIFWLGVAVGVALVLLFG